MAFYEEDEKSSELFLNLEKYYHEKKCIRQLKLDNNELPLDETKILHYVTDYYQRLYHSNDTSSNYDLFDLQAKKKKKKKKLEENENIGTNKLLTLGEIL